MADPIAVHFKEVEFGFQFGAAEVTRCMSDAKKGWVMIQVKTPKGMHDIYVTKTGKVRIWGPGHKEWKP